MNEIIILAEIAIGFDATVWMVQGTDNRRRVYFEEVIVLNGEQIARVTHKKAIGMEWLAKNKARAAEHMVDVAQITANKAEADANRAARRADCPVQMTMGF